MGRDGGWSHARSDDLVTWIDEGVPIVSVNETHAGMGSYDSPCSGFVAVDAQGTVCAGFRQCSSERGATELNPSAQAWDVPLELRCASGGANLTGWGAPSFVLPVYYYRALPYDPAIEALHKKHDFRRYQSC